MLKNSHLNNQIGQKNKVLGHTISGIIRGLVLATVVAITLPAKSQGLNSKEVQDQIQTEYILQKLNDSGKLKEFMFALVKSDNSINKIVGLDGKNMSKKDIQNIIKDIPSEPTSEMMIHEVLNSKIVPFLESIVGATRGKNPVKIIKEALIFSSDSTNLFNPGWGEPMGGDPLISKPMSEDEVNDMIVYHKFNKTGFDNFVNTASRDMISALVSHPEILSPNQRNMVSELSKSLINNKDITKTKYTDWMTPAERLSLQNTSGLKDLIQKNNSKLKKKIDTTNELIQDQSNKIGILGDEINNIKNGLAQIADGAEKERIKKVLREKQEAIIQAKIDQAQKTKELFNEAHGYVNIAKGIGQLIGNSDPRTAKAISDATVVASNVLTIAENINALMEHGIAGSIATGNMIGAAMNIVGLFASHGPDAATLRHNQLMDQFRIVNLKLDELKKDMNDRFDRVDQKLETISEQLKDIQMDITRIKNNMERGFSNIGRTMESIATADLRDRYNEIVIGCLREATIRVNNTYDTHRLPECKSKIVNMITIGATNPVFTGFGIGTTIENLPLALEERGMEGSINIVNTIVSGNEINFTNTPPHTGLENTALINPEISKVALDDYLHILKIHGITAIDKANIEDIITKLIQLNAISGNMANISENGLLDQVLKLYEQKRIIFMNEIETTIHTFEDKKSNEISKILKDKNYPPVSDFEKIKLINSSFLDNNLQYAINLALKNGLIFKSEEKVGKTNFLINEKPDGLIEFYGGVDFKVSINDVYSSFDKEEKFSIPNRGHFGNHQIEIGTYCNDILLHLCTKEGPYFYDGIFCYQKDIGFGRDYDYNFNSIKTCIEAMEDQLLVLGHPWPYSTPEGDATKMKLLEYIYKKYIAIRKEGSVDIKNEILNNTSLLHKSYNEFRGAYALLDALTYFGLQFNHEHDPVFMEKLAKLSPQRVIKQLNAIRAGEELTWDPKWNTDIFGLNELYGATTQNATVGNTVPNTDEAIVVKNLRSKLQHILDPKNNRIIGLRSVLEMEKSIKVIEKKY